MNDDFEANVTDDKPCSGARPRFMDGLLMRVKALHWIVAGFVLGLTLGLWLISVRDNSSNAAINQSPVTVAAAERTDSADIANNPSPDGAGVPPPTTAGSSATVETDEQTDVASREADTYVSPSLPPTDKQPLVRQDQKASKPFTVSDTAPSRKSLAAAGTVGVEGNAPERRQRGGRCTMSVSTGSLSLRGGNSATVTVSADDLNGNGQVTAATNNWSDIAVFPESRGGGSGGRVRFRVVSVSKRAGVFAVSFKSRCGAKTIPVAVTQSN